VRHYYASQTYVAASRQLDEACRWLDSIGVGYSGTRLAKYRKIFSDLARLQIADKLGSFLEKHSLDDWINAVHESTELVRIHEGLRDANDPSLISRLKSALRGHEMYVLDKDDRSGRDFTFELAVVAKFAKQGFPVNFDSEADVEAVVNGATVYVECKRLKSEKKIEERIKEGVKQLSRRYAASPDPSAVRGILALSIGKVVNSSLTRFQGRDAIELGAKASRCNAAFIERFGHLWQSNPAPQTLGTLVVLDSPGELLLEKKLTTIHEVMLNNCVPSDSARYSELVVIASNVFAPKT
jgi:hypothetical protein